jgi:very-short-patch-repair endonuclease
MQKIMIDQNRNVCTFNPDSQEDMVYITKSFQGILNFGAKREIFENAKELRRNETEAEKALWKAVRSRRLDGLKIRRQHPVKQFILDFYCHEFLLGIEIDGSVHENDEAKDYDLNRTAELENLGITLLRFKNEEVLTNLSKVITDIRNKVVQLKNASIL